MNRKHDDMNVNLSLNMKPEDYMVAFSGNTENYCIGIVDMVNSTKIAATLGNKKIQAYYETLKFFVKNTEQIWRGCYKKCRRLSCVLFSRVIKIQ
ncbi:MAG: hypothetical protein OEL69_08630 [Nitrosopumilus sp.]|nr:hypothetical protein [Nitrosopumilus sp.]